jgi:N-acetyl-1-D-myo-inositol-2-amino-2-deoxy-alpha-D-glucopyranoside deacetylase
MSDTPGLMCVHAHPDDEAIWTGGILGKYAAEGVRTAVVTCTDGFSTVGKSFAPEGTRVRELAASLAVLGAGEPRLLGYHDSGSGGDLAADSFCAAPFDEAVGRLTVRIRQFRPEVVVTYDAFGAYGHRDHVQAHRVTMAAVEAAAIGALYPESGAAAAWRVREVWLVTLPLSLVDEAVRRGIYPPGAGTPDDQVHAYVDVRPWLDIKWAALEKHESELERTNRFGGLFDDVTVRDRFLGVECFVRRTAPGARDAPAAYDLSPVSR